MKIIHQPSHYEVVPDPVYEVNMRIPGMFSFFSTQVTGTATLRKPYGSLSRLTRAYIGIDFENEDVNSLIENMLDSRWSMPGSLYKRDHFESGTAYHGVFPYAHEHDNVWKCSFDYSEPIMSHRQHYRYKDFPIRIARQEYTTFDSFRKILSSPEIQHVIVDKLTHDCLAHSFEDFQDEAQIATAAERMSGLILKFGPKLVFADTYLPTDRHWVNENPGNPSARAQYIVIAPEVVRQWPATE